MEDSSLQARHEAVREKVGGGSESVRERGWRHVMLQQAAASSAQNDARCSCKHTQRQPSIEGWLETKANSDLWRSHGYRDSAD